MLAQVTDLTPQAVALEHQARVLELVGADLAAAPGTGAEVVEHEDQLGVVTGRVRQRARQVGAEEARRAP